jgi:hypothetical protein
VVIRDRILKILNEIEGKEKEYGSQTRMAEMAVKAKTPTP